MAVLRKPKVFRSQEVRNRIPPHETVKGMRTHYAVTKEKDNARSLIHAFCYQGAEMEDLVWKAEENDYEEICYCAEGQLKLIATPLEGGDSIELVAEQGDSLFLVSGYEYRMVATGQESLNIFVRAPTKKLPEDYAKKQRELGLDRETE